MAEEKPIKTLDLDEILGQVKAIKVRRNGIEYELCNISAMSVHKVLQFQSFRQKVSILQTATDISPEQADEIEKLFNQMLHILCEDLPLSEIKYTEKTAILAFYFTETAPKKVKSPTRKSLTGATPSQS